MTRPAFSRTSSLRSDGKRFEVFFVPFSYPEDEAIADIAVQASAPTLAMLFGESAIALENQMVELSQLKKAKKVTLSLSASEADKLLFDFLNELLFLKDAKQLLFSKVKVKISQKGGKFVLKAECWGEKLNAKKHELRNDVKACTFHGLKVEKARKGWKCHFVLDV